MAEARRDGLGSTGIHVSAVAAVVITSDAK
jgi:hypothetical protein